jgi:[acyl-carrier-protein] S-malonyltransferase
MSYKACAFYVTLTDQKLGGKVVKQRGASMAVAAGAGARPHGMLSVIGLGDEALEALCGAARARLPPGTVCQVANLLFPTGRVVSGHQDALAEARARLAPRGPPGRVRHVWHRACQP